VKTFGVKIRHVKELVACSGIGWPGRWEKSSQGLATLAGVINP
jgi:hypothetical protein